MVTTVGTSGNDILNGVNGTDNLIYGDTSDSIQTPVTGGNDTITGGANATNTIFGDAATLQGAGATGENDGDELTNLLWAMRVRAGEAGTTPS